MTFLTRGWWPLLVVFAFVWIVPAALGFGFRCQKTDPTVPETPSEDLQALSAAESSRPAPSWAAMIVPMAAGAGVIASRIRGRRL